MTPEKGSRWTHPRLRHVWAVTAAGAQWITLTARFPGSPKRRVPLTDWPGAWESKDDRS